MLASLVLAGLALAASPAVSPTYGVVGAQIMRSPICSASNERACLEMINNGDTAVSYEFSFTGQPVGFSKASVTEGGMTQCVFTTGPNGTRCVSVLAPGEHGWIMFPTITVIGVEVTEWSMPGLSQENQSIMPGTALPVTVIGDPALIKQGTLATVASRHGCYVDLKVRGNNTLYASMCVGG